MSIKNIIQQENDLQEMSQQSLRNYLNSPTGQYNPYLVAGELQRKEQYAERKMVEAPQQTVVDELVQNTMPMGGMPQMPRPQEAMVSDTITETGIANLPAPNIGQNYAEGGIIGYEGGGGVSGGGAFEDEIELGKAVMEMAEDPSVVAEVGGTALMKTLGVASPYIKGLGLAGLFYSPELGNAENPDFAGYKPVQNYAGGGRVRFGTKVMEYGEKKIEKIKDLYNKFTNKKTATPPAPKKKLTKKEQDAFLKQQKTPPQTALEKANQFKDTRSATQKIKDKAKELYRSTSPDKGPLTRAGIAALRGTGQGVGPLTRGVKTGATKYPVESLLGLGALGYGADAIFGDTPEEIAAAKAKAAEDKAATDQAQLDLVENTRLKNQAGLDAAQAKRDAAAKRRAYLALALGGAKTMAGQSQYALTNIGEGVGTGVAGLVELEEADAARQATVGIAEQKYMNDLYKETISQMDTFNDLKLKLRGGEDQTFTQVFLGRLDDKGIDPSDVTNPDYIKIENETIIDLYPGAAPRGSTMVAGQPFIGV